MLKRGLHFVAAQLLLWCSLCLPYCCVAALQDKAVKAKIDAKNQLETYIYSIKSTVEDKAKVRVLLSGAQMHLPHGWLHTALQQF